MESRQLSLDHREDDFSIEIQWGNVGLHRGYAENGSDMILVEGAKVKGRCARHKNSHHYYVPTFEIFVKYAKENAKYDPQNYQKMLELAEKIKGAFSAGARALPPLTDPV